jgi:integrase
VLALLDRTRFDQRLLFVFLEQTGERLGETLGWTCCRVDHANMRILSGPENVRDRRGHRRARSVQSLGWLFGILARRRPPEYRDTEKRSSRRRTISGTRDRSRNAIARVRRAARTPHHHSHDLRHRTIRLWHGQRGPALNSGEPASQRRVSASTRR